MSLERRVLTEFLELYKNFPCLWDNKHVLYSNKEARDQAYEVMLEKYRQLQEDATIVDLKKRIENMRTSFRREHKKVLISRLNPLESEHVPQLWYYEHLSFLGDVLDFKFETLAVENGDDSMKIEFDEESQASYHRLIDTPQSRTKKRKVSAIYVQEQNDSDEDNGPTDVDEMQLNQVLEYPQSNTLNANKLSESEAFGTTVGLQLKELDSMQRVYAEKLISDVIYHARLHRLTFNSNLNI